MRAAPTPRHVVLTQPGMITARAANRAPQRLATLIYLYILI
jgi:hypothetical protein